MSSKTATQTLADILPAEDLTPSDTAGLDPAFILGFATAGGGPTGHSAIIARALGIPAVVGAGPTQPSAGFCASSQRVSRMNRTR